MYIDDNVPRIHNINAILQRFEDILVSAISEERLNFFDRLSGYYLNNRYPEYTSKLSLQINELNAQEILSQTQEVFAWLLTLHP